MKPTRQRPSTFTTSEVRCIEISNSLNSPIASKYCSRKVPQRKGHHKSSKHSDNTLSRSLAEEPDGISIEQSPYHRAKHEPEFDGSLNTFQQPNELQLNPKVHEPNLNQCRGSERIGDKEPNRSVASTINDAGSIYSELEPLLTTDSNSDPSTASSRSSSNSPNFCSFDDFTSGDYIDRIYDVENDAYVDTDGSLIAHLGRRTMKRKGADATSPHYGATEQINSRDTDPVDRDLPIKEDVENSQSYEGVDQSSFTSTPSPISGATPATPPSDSENPSSEDKGSSDSRRSSKTSDSGAAAEASDRPDKQETSLQGLIHKELNDPEVAEELFHELNGMLECAPRHYLESIDHRGELPLFDLLECQDAFPMDHPGNFTCATSSSAGSPSSTRFKQGGGAAPISPNSQSTQSPGSGAGKRGASPNQGPGVKRQKNGSRSNSSKPAKCFNFRCFHNILAPEVFRINHETQDRFRACAGPGWNTIQHLRDHMQSHHIEKPPIHCSRCQVKFGNPDMLKSHETDVDCPVICPSCDGEFPNKATRLQHQQEKHVDESKESKFLEIDDALDKKIRANLKTYTDLVKKGKGLSNPKLEKWIDNHTERYMIGRDATAKPRLELGQWYIIFTTLTSSDDVLDHPFYDYDGLTPSDLAEERILFIHERHINARIAVHGPPPEELPQQVAWYQDVLRDSLKVAKKTKWTKFSPQNQLVSSPEQLQEAGNSSMGLSSSYASMARDSHALRAGFEQQIIGTPHRMTSHEISTHQQLTPPLDSHDTTTMIGNAHLSLPSTYLTRDQHTGMVTMSPAAMTPHSANLMDSQLQTAPWQYQNSVGGSMGQAYNPTYNYNLQPEFNPDYLQTASEMLDASLDPSLEQPPEYTHSWSLRNQGPR